ncbi:MAG: twin-arginine translocase subunit TatC [Anaerolineae bacterium]|nr:twin-arginine translocase subunit TatC [Anaerolineae bacterium]
MEILFSMAEEPSQMTLLGHIKELRKRLLICVIALALTTIASFAFSQSIASFLAEPIGGLQAMSSIDITENMSAFMRISLLSGVILALPVIFYQILAFVIPGLNTNERTWIWMAIPSATLFFVAGVAFAYFVMLPVALPFLINFMGIATSPRPKTYFSFVSNLMFWVGVIFEMPLLMYILARLKIVTAKSLVKQWRIALVVSAVVAALITPTSDPVNMGLMMLPLFVLYLISILFAILARREKKERVKKKWSKRKRIIVLTVLLLTLSGIAFAYFRFPQELVDFLFIIMNAVVSWWNAASGFLSSLGK